MSFKVVMIESCGHECGNAQRFATEEEAEASYHELASRWTLCPGEHRIAESDDPVNYVMDGGRPMSIASGHKPPHRVSL